MWNILQPSTSPSEAPAPKKRKYALLLHKYSPLFIQWPFDLLLGRLSTQPLSFHPHHLVKVGWEGLVMVMLPYHDYQLAEQIFPHL